METRTDRKSIVIGTVIVLFWIGVFALVVKGLYDAPLHCISEYYCAELVNGPAQTP